MSKNVSPSKPQRILVEHESNTTVPLSTPAFLSLAKRAGKSKYPLTVLEQVYCRGIIASKYHPKNTPEQQAFNRVDSFIHEGKAYELDMDLISETPSVPNGRKHMYIIKNAIKHHEERNKPEETDKPIEEDWASAVGVGLGGLALRALGVGKKKKAPRTASNDPEDIVRKKIQNKEIDYRVKQGFAKLHPELSQKAKNIQRKKSIVRKSLSTGEQLRGEPLRLKTRFRTIKDAIGRRRKRAGAIEHTAKKTGLTTNQVQQSVGIPVRADQKEKIDYNQSQKASQEYQKYWSSRTKKPKPGSGVG